VKRIVEVEVETKRKRKGEREKGRERNSITIEDLMRMIGNMIEWIMIIRNIVEIEDQCILNRDNRIQGVVEIHILEREDNLIQVIEGNHIQKIESSLIQGTESSLILESSHILVESRLRNRVNSR